MMFTLIRQNSGSYTHHLHPTQSVSPGFTLIELLITIAILGILAAIVIPSYNAQVRKGSRSDAITALTRAAQGLERCHSDTLIYNHDSCTDYTVSGGIPSDRGLYTIEADTVRDEDGNITDTGQNEQTFKLKAEAVPGTTQANDTNCTVFTIDHTGSRSAYSSATTRNASTNTTTECWR